MDEEKKNALLYDLIHVLEKHGAYIASSCQTGCELELYVGRELVSSFMCAIPEDALK